MVGPVKSNRFGSFHDYASSLKNMYNTDCERKNLHGSLYKVYACFTLSWTPCIKALLWPLLN